MSGQMMASRLMDLNLYAADGANLGDIDDLVLDRNGTVTAVVVGVGGFLGIGEKAVAIPFSSIRIEPQANDRDRLVVSATRDELRNAPEFRMSDARRSGADRRTAPTTTTPGAPGTTTPPTTPQR
jgi:sporulation protein YlmC with PRC-barrel domain